MPRARLASVPQAQFVLPLIVVAVLLVLPPPVRAYDNDATHQHLVNTATEIFAFPDLMDNLPIVVFGAWCEDETDHVYDTSGEWITLPHFWIADEGDEQINWWGAYGYENAWMKARIMIVRSRDFYLAGNHFEAYHYLGHVCHLLADMTVPAHAHYDEHSDDAYENWMASWHYHVSAGVANLYGPVPPITDEIIQQIMDAWGGVSPGPIDLLPPLYYLMYTANQRADYFASDGDDGNLDTRYGWVDYTGWPSRPRTRDDLVDCDENDTDVDGKLSNIAYKCASYAVSATARLYEVWSDSIDPVPPETHLVIAGPDSVHEGWRPGNVVMNLTADDNYTGVHETRHGGYQYASVLYTEPVLIDHEGITYFSYQSLDRFGNEEELHQQMVKIDRTPPVLSILSPVPDGHYLSSGVLTVDYEADDEPSGLYGFTATLDGQPVADGQTFDMALLAGFHTLVLTAEDKAGNTSSSSVDFSIKIDATVRLQPEKLDLESAGGVLTAFVGFPAPYSVNNIQVPATILSVGGVNVPANPKLSEVGSVGVDGLPERSFKFKRAPICTALAGQSGAFEPVVSGVLTNGTEFWGVGRLEITADDAVTLETGDPGSDGAQVVVPTVLAVRALAGAGVSGALIEYALPEAGEYSLRIYDVRGRLVTPLGNGQAAAGVHRLEWDGRDRSGARAPLGVYFLRLENRGGVAVGKMVVGGR